MGDKGEKFSLNFDNSEAIDDHEEKSEKIKWTPALRSLVLGIHQL